jgi:hypothetical protein
LLSLDWNGDCRTVRPSVTGAGGASGGDHVKELAGATF